MECDYVVVGVGAAGALVCNALSSRFSVIGIEAGDYISTTSVPITDSEFAGLEYGLENDWNPTFFYQQQAARNGSLFTRAKKATSIAVACQRYTDPRTVEMLQMDMTGSFTTGRVLGGGSSINGQQCVRPSRACVDQWVREIADSRGASAWSASHVESIFKRLENYYRGPRVKVCYNNNTTATNGQQQQQQVETKEEAFLQVCQRQPHLQQMTQQPCNCSSCFPHGLRGNMHVRQAPSDPSQMAIDFISALAQIGYARIPNDDYNDPQTPFGSFAKWQLFQLPTGVRANSVIDFLSQLSLHLHRVYCETSGVQRRFLTNKTSDGDFCGKENNNKKNKKIDYNNNNDGNNGNNGNNGGNGGNGGIGSNRTNGHKYSGCRHRRRCCGRNCHLRRCPPSCHNNNQKLDLLVKATSLSRRQKLCILLQATALWLLWENGPQPSPLPVSLPLASSCSGAIFSSSRTTPLQTRANNKAIGVRVLHNGVPISVYGRRGVILCAGIYSAQLLQRSGIGPAPLLRCLGIPLVYNNPNVGMHLSNQLFVTISFRAPDNVIGLPSSDLASLYTGGAFLPPLLPQDNPAIRGYQLIGGFPAQAQFQIMLSYLQPKSEGKVEIQSTDPLTPSLADNNYGAKPLDEWAFVVAVRQYIVPLAAALATINPAYRLVEPNPDTVIPNDTALGLWVRANLDHTHHWTSACRISTSPGCGVVDATGHVYGASGLHVADASILPSNPDGNTCASAYLAAAIVSDSILAHQS